MSDGTVNIFFQSRSDSGNIHLRTRNVPGCVLGPYGTLVSLGNFRLWENSKEMTSHLAFLFMHMELISKTITERRSQTNNHYRWNQLPPWEYAFLESTRGSVLDRERDWFKVGQDLYLLAHGAVHHWMESHLFHRYRCAIRASRYRMFYLRKLHDKLSGVWFFISSTVDASINAHSKYTLISLTT